MERLNGIVKSIFAPSSTKDIWLNEGTLKYFGPNGWEGLKSTATVSWNEITGKPTSFYTLPSATTTKIGGVKKAAAVANLATGADAAAIVTAFNQLLANLRSAGVLTA